MVGDRRRVAAKLAEAAEKAGTLVTAALALSGAALLVAVVALVIAVKGRH